MSYRCCFAKTASSRWGWSQHWAFTLELNVVKWPPKIIYSKRSEDLGMSEVFVS